MNIVYAEVLSQRHSNGAISERDIYGKPLFFRTCNYRGAKFFVFTENPNTRGHYMPRIKSFILPPDAHIIDRHVVKGIVCFIVDKLINPRVCVTKVYTRYNMHGYVTLLETDGGVEIEKIGATRKGDVKRKAKRHTIKMEVKYGCGHFLWEANDKCGLCKQTTFEFCEECLWDMEHPEERGM